MKHQWSRFAAAAVALVGLAFGSVASAQTDTANLTVTATVADSCVLRNAPTLDFGTLVLSALNTDAAAGIDWSCTNGSTADITLGGGGSGDINARAMDSGADALAYQLYTDVARTTVFGDGAGNGDAVTVTGTGYTNTLTTQVYGRVLQADAQGADPGVYNDTVLITITF